VEVAELPVALFAYDRPDLLRETLACLERAGFRRLIAFADGPRGDEDAGRVEEVREVLRSIRWADVERVEHQSNVGLSDSIVGGLSRVFEGHERAVVIEDDIAVAPEFGIYVAAALEQYADDGAVAGVTGLRLPFDRGVFERYGYDAFTLPRFHSWGWATWRRSWQQFDFDRDRVLEGLRRPHVRPEHAGADVPGMLRNAVVHGRVAGAWDLFCQANLLIQDRVFVLPTWNMVENRGFERGTHVARPRPWTLRWETEAAPDLDRLRFPPPTPDGRVLRAYQLFAEYPLGWTPRQLMPRSLRFGLRRVRGTYDVFR
jgi:hypothetical protein